MRRAVPLLLLAVLLCGAGSAAAGAAELKVLSAGAMRAALQQLGAAFEAASGEHLALEYATAGQVAKRVAAGEGIDVAILTRPRIAKLEHDGEIRAGSTVLLARAAI